MSWITSLRQWWRLRRIKRQLSRYSPKVRAALLELAQRRRKA